MENPLSSGETDVLDLCDGFNLHSCPGHGLRCLYDVFILYVKYHNLLITNKSINSFLRNESLTSLMMSVFEN